MCSPSARPSLVWPEKNNSYQSCRSWSSVNASAFGQECQKGHLVLCLSHLIWTLAFESLARLPIQIRHAFNMAIIDQGWIETAQIGGFSEEWESGIRRSRTLSFDAGCDIVQGDTDAPGGFWLHLNGEDVLEYLTIAFGEIFLVWIRIIHWKWCQVKLLGNPTHHISSKWCWRFTSVQCVLIGGGRWQKRTCSFILTFVSSDAGRIL